MLCFFGLGLLLGWFNEPNVLDLADPLVGTATYGHTFPGATVPFGMVQLSPDTDTRFFKQSYPWAAGYKYEDTSILGFSHTHFSGSGHSDLGDFLLVPQSGEVQWQPGTADGPGYRSAYSHAREKATPGSYSVVLDRHDITAELTASQRVGWHRYTFPKGQASVLLDLRSSIYDYEGKILWSRIRVHADGTVTGFRETRGWAPGRQIFFAMRFSQPFTHRLRNFEKDVIYRGFQGPAHDSENKAQTEGRLLAGVFEFGDLQEPLLIKLAISTVSEAGALKNLQAEAPSWDFEATRQAAQSSWREALSVVQAQGEAPALKTFYSALYHCLLGPTLCMDVDGAYRGPDQAIHHAKDFAFQSTFSLWDTYRAQQPLLTLIQNEQRNADFALSLMASQEHSPFGILPIWQYHGQETWCMIGYHAVPVLADIFLKGNARIDGKKALEAMVASASYAPYGGLDSYMKLGYVAIDQEDEAASKTLEYAFDDWTIAVMAKRLGENEVAEQFMARARNYQNVMDAQTGFARARKSDGAFREPFDPNQAGYGSDYTEGNAWQYSWYVPHDVFGLAQSIGGGDRLASQLDHVFAAQTKQEDFAHVEDISGLIGQYAHGNEPSHHVAYLYAYLGQAWKTQAHLTKIVTTQYGPGPDGLSGNDDLGQMSAWYVFTAMGFYPVAPASNQYVLGRPFLPELEIRLPNGRSFQISAKSFSQANIYVKKVTLNGKDLKRCFITHEEILAGGHLVFEMAAKPQTQYWRSAERPYSLSTQKGF